MANEPLNSSLPLAATDRDFLWEHLQYVPPFRALVRAVESGFFAAMGGIENPALDLGCGDGLFAVVTFQTPFATGIDPDALVITSAENSGRYVSVIKADATRMPFADGAFSSVVANCSLEHIPDLEGALGEVRRVLKPGGKFILSVPSHYFGAMLLGSTFLRFFRLKTAAEAYASYFNRISRHFHTDSPETWLERLDQHGFRAISHSYYLNAKAHRMFDISHYLSIHCLLSHRLTGSWTALTPGWLNRLYERWLRPYYRAAHGEPGPYLFFIAEKKPL